MTPETIEIKGCFLDHSPKTKRLIDPNAPITYWVWSTAMAAYYYAGNNLDAARSCMASLPDPCYHAYFLYERGYSPTTGFSIKNEIARRVTNRPEFMETPRSD